MGFWGTAEVIALGIVIFDALLLIGLYAWFTWLQRHPHRPRVAYIPVPPGRPRYRHLHHARRNPDDAA